MDKKALVKELEARIAADLAVITQTALAAHGAATHAESKAEDQYDTRGLEASYLAGAASKRAMDLQETLAIFRYVDLQTFTKDTPIASTALVELVSDGKRFLYFLMPKGGGMSVSLGGKQVNVITPQSPMGEALLGRRVGDEIDVQIQRVSRDYEISAVW